MMTKKIDEKSIKLSSTKKDSTVQELKLKKFIKLLNKHQNLMIIDIYILLKIEKDQF